MHKPTASALERSVPCDGAVVLPRVTEDTPHAGLGQIIHAFLAAVPTVGRGEALAVVLHQHGGEAYEACATIPLDALPLDPSRFRPEVALAFDLDTGTGRELGQHLGRDYSGLRDSELAGTADVLGVDVSGDMVHVGDYKSGHASVTPARVNKQLRFLALAACRTYGINHARVAIIRTCPGTEPWYDQADLGPYELAEIEAELLEARERWARAAEAYRDGTPPDVHTGSHCSYCPSKPWCPAFQQLIARMATSPGDVVQEIQAQLTPQLAARAYHQLQLAKEALGLVEGALRGWATEHPIALVDGGVYGFVNERQTEIDGELAHQVLADLHGREVADKGVTFEASKASLERALKPVREATGKPVAPMLREVLEKLEQRGGLRVRLKPKLKEHRPRRTEAPPSELGAPTADIVP